MVGTLVVRVTHPTRFDKLLSCTVNFVSTYLHQSKLVQNKLIQSHCERC
jgi:hypothetical protein